MLLASANIIGPIRELLTMSLENIFLTGTPGFDKNDYFMVGCRESKDETYFYLPEPFLTLLDSYLVFY